MNREQGTVNSEQGTTAVNSCQLTSLACLLLVPSSLTLATSSTDSLACRAICQHLVLARRRGGQGCWGGGGWSRERLFSWNTTTRPTLLALDKFSSSSIAIFYYTVIFRIMMLCDNLFQVTRFERRLERRLLTWAQTSSNLGREWRSCGWPGGPCSLLGVLHTFEGGGGSEDGLYREQLQ